MSYDLNGNTIEIRDADAGSPVINKQPANRLAEPNGNAGFSVNVSSGSPVTYQWQFNNANIPGATGDSLYLPTVTAAQEGSYRVIVTNASGSVTSQAATLFLDSNNNGMADTWELTYFGNLNQLPGGDFDGDSITNLEEYQNGTNPAVREPYYWTATSGDLNTAANWNRNRIPGAGDTVYITSGTFTPPASLFAASQVTVSTPYTAPANADVTFNISGTWTFTGPVTLANDHSFTVKGAGGQVILAGPTIISGAHLSVQNSAVLSLPGVTSYDLSTDHGVLWRAESNGSQLNFPNLTTITGAPAAGCYLFVSAYLASISFPALTSITKADDADPNAPSGIQFNTNGGGTISAPLLSTFNDNGTQPGSSLETSGAGLILVPSLSAPKGVSIALNALSNPQHFDSLQKARYLKITGGSVTMNLLSSIAGLSIEATNGASLSLPLIHTYHFSGSTGLAWTASDYNSQLLFPNLTTITGSQAPGGYLDVNCYDAGAQVSFPALTSITKANDGNDWPDSGIRFDASSGGSISAPLLTTFSDNDNHPDSGLSATYQGTILVPSLLAPKGVNIALNAQSDPQHFVSLENASRLTITGGVVVMSQLSSIDGLSIAVTDGASLSLPAITTYSLNNLSYTDWSAYGNGSSLIFPNLTTISGTPLPWGYLNVTNYSGTSLISLPALLTITKGDDGDGEANSGVRFTSYGSSTISAPLLVTFRDTDNIPDSELNRLGSSQMVLSQLTNAGILGVKLTGISLPGLTPLQTWQQTYWPGGASDPSAAMTATPLNDGITNALKYALGMVPTIPVPTGLPSLTRTNSGPAFTFKRARQNVLYEVQTSIDLKSWSTLITNPGSPGDVVMVTIPTESGVSRFVRLSVVLR